MHISHNNFIWRAIDDYKTSRSRLYVYYNSPNRLWKMIKSIIKSQPAIEMPKRVLVIGSSTGYGLAARISAAFGGGASTLGIFFENQVPIENLALPVGTTAAFHKKAEEEGLYAKSINGDAFSNEIKQKTIETIKQDMGQVDLVIYSLAAPRRQHPDTGEVFNSTLKPVGKDVTMLGVNTDKEEVQEFSQKPLTSKKLMILLQ